MHAITDGAALIKRSNNVTIGAPDTHRFLITNSVANLDTLGIYCWRPIPRDVLASWRKEYGRRLHVTHYRPPRTKMPKKKRGPPKPRCLIEIDQPTRATLGLLKELQRGGGFTISRCDIAVDFICRTMCEAESLQAFLKVSVVQRWRRRGNVSHVELSTTYANRDKRARRNSRLYNRECKAGHGPCAHFELRYRGSQACKRRGLGDFNTLIAGLDAMALLGHEARIVFVDFGAVERVAEKFVLPTKRKHPKMSVAEIRKRNLNLLAHRVQDEDWSPDKDGLSMARAQAFYDLGPLWRICLRDLMPWSSFTLPPRWHHW